MAAAKPAIAAKGKATIASTAFEAKEIVDRIFCFSHIDQMSAIGSKADTARMPSANSTNFSAIA